MHLIGPQSDNDDNDDAESEDLSYDSVVHYVTWEKGTALSRAELKVEAVEGEWR
jgi:hypothetical protein